MPTKFPYQIDDEFSLLTAKDNVTSSLTSNVTITSTVIYVSNASHFPEEGFITIHDKKFSVWEKIYYTERTSNTFKNLTRDDPKEFSCDDCVFVSALITEDYHNYLRDAIIEIEKRFVDSSSDVMIVIDDDTGITKYQDPQRSFKWLSTSRQTFEFSRSRASLKDQYLRYGNIPTSVNGPHLIRPVTITALSVSTSNLCNVWFRIRRNNSPFNLHSIQLSNISSKVRDNIIIDLDKEDMLQVYMEVTSGTVDYPLVIVEYSYRF